jgi:cell division septation protein DedD
MDSAPRAPADSPTTLASAPRDTVFARRADSTPTMTPVSPPRQSQPDTTSRTPTARPAPTLPPGGRFRVQITAVGTAAAADAIARKLGARGLAAVTVQEGGLYKVRVGNYASRAEAVAALPKIKAKLGGSPFVVAEP